MENGISLLTAPIAPLECGASVSVRVERLGVVYTFRDDRQHTIRHVPFIVMVVSDLGNHVLNMSSSSSNRYGYHTLIKKTFGSNLA